MTLRVLPSVLLILRSACFPQRICSASPQKKLHGSEHSLIELCCGEEDYLKDDIEEEGGFQIRKPAGALISVHKKWITTRELFYQEGNYRAEFGI